MNQTQAEAFGCFIGNVIGCLLNVAFAVFAMQWLWTLPISILWLGWTVLYGPAKLRKSYRHWKEVS